jgi:hypothetical protein
MVGAFAVYGEFTDTIWPVLLKIAHFIAALAKAIWSFF